jgi:hypothetical protein
LEAQQHKKYAQTTPLDDRVSSLFIFYKNYLIFKANSFMALHIFKENSYKIVMRVKIYIFELIFYGFFGVKGPRAGVFLKKCHFVNKLLFICEKVVKFSESQRITNHNME